MEYRCKFCGKIVKTPSNLGYKHFNPDDVSCSECGKYCMKECEKASSVQGWNYEPCVSCEHNPYRALHVWEGNKWRVMEDV